MNDASSLARNAAAAAISDRLAEAPHRDVHEAACRPLGILGEELGQQRRVHRTRAQGIDPYPLAGELHSELARHRQHAALAGGVADLAGGGAHHGDERGGVDDRSLSPCQQVGQRVLAAQIHRGQVHPLHAVPRLETRLENGVVVGRADAGVVATDVEAAVAGGHLAVQRLDLVRGGHVGPHEHAANGGGDLPACLIV